MSWEQHKDAAAKSHHVGHEATKNGCECGGVFVLSKQSIGYSREDQCMTDLMVYQCQKCQKEKSITIPLQGKAYQGMTDFFQKRDESGK